MPQSSKSQTRGSGAPTFVISILGWVALYVLGVISAPAAGSLAGATIILLGVHLRWPWPEWVLSALLMATSVQWCLAVVDVGMRAWLPDSFYFRAHERLIQRWPDARFIERYRPAASIVQPSVGDLAAMAGKPEWQIPREIAFITDEAGFRNARRSSTTGAVIVLGDSFAVGNGITQHLSWSGLLADRLDRPVINLAIPSSPWMSLANFWYEADRVGGFADADVLLLLFSGNDLDETYGPALDRARLDHGAAERWLTRLRNFRGRGMVAKLFMRLSITAEHSASILPVTTAAETPVLFYEPYVERALRDAAEVEAHANFKRLGRTIWELSKLVKQHGGRLTVVNVPSKVEIYPELLDRPFRAQGFAQAVRPVVDRLRANWLDLTPALRQGAEQRADVELLWWRDDTHWNAAGHALVADVIEHYLAEAEGGGTP